MIARSSLSRVSVEPRERTSRFGGAPRRTAAEVSSAHAVVHTQLELVRRALRDGHGAGARTFGAELHLERAGLGFAGDTAFDVGAAERQLPVAGARHEHHVGVANR